MKRVGISLVEVLISMFVLLIGLLGVAALIPAGNHEIATANKIEAAAIVGRSAMRDLYIRDLLNPRGTPTLGAPLNAWINDLDDPDYRLRIVWNPEPSNQFGPFTPDIRVAVADRYFSMCAMVDPLGMIAGGATVWPVLPPDPVNPVTPFLVRCTTIDRTLDPKVQRALAESTFMCDTDRTLLANTGDKSLPPTQQWQVDGSNNPLGRQFEGNCSYLYTVVSPEILPAEYYTVSVAVFYKRVPGAASEHVGQITSAAASQEVTISGANVTLKPGSWIMLAGTKWFKWYRIMTNGTKDPAAPQVVTLHGSDWPDTDPMTAGTQPPFTQAWVFDGVVNVFEKQLPIGPR